MGFADFMKATDQRVLANTAMVGESITLTDLAEAATVGDAILSDEPEQFEEGERTGLRRQRTIQATLPVTTFGNGVQRGWTILSAGVWVTAGTYTVSEVISRDPGAVVVRAVLEEPYQTVGSGHRGI